MGLIGTIKGMLGMNYDDGYYEEELAEGETDTSSHLPARKRTPRLIKFPSPRDKSIYTLQPTSYDDATIAGDYLKVGAAVFVNLQNIDPTLGRRMVDVLSGICYGIDGHAHKVGDRLFLFLPHDFFITSEEKSHLESQSLFLNGFRENARPAMAGKQDADKSSGGPVPFERANLFTYNS